MPERWVERVPDPEPVADLDAEPARDVLPESLAALMPESAPDRFADPLPPEPRTDQSRMLTDRLAIDLAGVTWPAPERIRALGRRRRRRAAVGGPAAVVLVFAVIWGLVGGLPGTGTGPLTVGGRPGADPAGPAVVASPATPARQPALVTSADDGWIPPVALLQPADLGLNFRLSEDSSGSVGGELWPFQLAQNCPAYAGLRATAYRSYVFSRGHSVSGDSVDGRPQTLTQQVTRYPDDRAARTVVDDARRVLTVCQTYDVPPTRLTGRAALADPSPSADPPSSAGPSGSADPSSSSSPSSSAGPAGSAEPVATERLVDPGGRTGGRHVVRVLGDGFAGSQSLLVRQEVTVPPGTPGTDPSGGGTITLYAVVRVGDMVAVLESYDYDDARMRQLAGRAAAWLCPFANPRC